MVNGTLSKILYLGAFGMMGLCVIGIIALSITEHAVPPELTVAFSSSLALIAGSHITPPNVHKESGPNGLIGSERASTYRQG